MEFLRFIIIGITLIINYVNCEGDTLKIISDEEFDKFVVDNYYVVAFFATKPDLSSGVYRNTLNLIKDSETEITDGLNGELVQLLDSKKLKEYGVTKTPAILFFRNKIPTLYEGQLEAKEFGEWLSFKRKQTFQDLDDHDFEYYSDAQNGRKGDWLILFCQFQSVGTGSCRPHLTTWESIHTRVAGKVNLARVRMEPNLELVNRFDARDPPSYIFLSRGKMYRYSSPQYDAASITQFVLQGYKNASSVKVPPFANKQEFTQTRSQRFLRSEFSDKHMPAAILCLALPFTIVLAAICVKCVTPELPIKQH